jgi:mannitol/fructose-specific phosphotransferase system IIA component (Ntr-type)
MEDNLEIYSLHNEFVRRQEMIAFMSMCLEDLSAIKYTYSKQGLQKADSIFRKMKSNGVAIEDFRRFLIEKQIDQTLAEAYITMYTKKINWILFENFNRQNTDEVVKQILPYITFTALTFLTLRLQDKLSNENFIEYLIAYYLISGGILQYIPNKS